MNEEILAVLEDIMNNTSHNYHIESHLETILKKIENMESIIESQNDTINNLSEVLDSIYDRIPSSVSTDYLAEKLDAIRNAIDSNSSYLSDIVINTGG